ncbi:GH25 family lysozyme [Pseudosulfitobacter sp. SM2401]|uniref:glycoside hydrolase family 25 protein n=1 Tax=Pseudosulfitobacter sp. SM2401 TaxID=3350098 RepID=UPI0036F37D3F
MAIPHPTGVDVSHFQGTVDFAKLKSGGQSFVSIKATQGTHYSSASYYTDNIDKARKTGLISGGYHFYSGTLDGADQANYFLEIAKPQKGDLLPMLDLEGDGGASPEQVASGALAWVDTVEKATGRKPFLYTTASFFAKIGNPKGFEECPLWVAEYGVTKPKLPAAWTLYTIWQYSQNGSVSGVTGDVDMDNFNGSAETLEKFRL